MTAPSVYPEPLVGTIHSISGDAIDVAVKGRADAIQVSRASVLRLEVSKGRNRKGGLLIGGISAAALGSVIGAVGCRDSGDWDSWQCAAILGGFGFAAGGAVGAMVGAGDRWTELPPDRFRVSLTPTSGRGVAVSMRFTF